MGKLPYISLTSIQLIAWWGFLLHFWVPEIFGDILVFFAHLLSLWNHYQWGLVKKPTSWVCLLEASYGTYKSYKEERVIAAGELLSEYICETPRCPLKGGPFPKESSLPNTIFFGRHLTVLGIRSRDIFRWVEIPDYLASYHGRDGLVQSEVQDMFGRVSRHFAKPYKMVFPDPHNSAVLLRTFN